MSIQAEENNEVPENETLQVEPADGADPIEQAVLHPDERELSDALAADKVEQDALAAAETAAKAEEAKKAAEATPTGAEADPLKKPAAQVPVEALVATRKKGQEAEAKVTERDARLAILAELADTLTPDQIRAIAAGKQTVEEAQAENAEDPHDLLDAKELDLAKKRAEGELDEVEFTRGMQAIRKERRAIELHQTAQTTVVERDQSVKTAIKAASNKIVEDFPIVKSLSAEQFAACKPIAAANTHAGMAAQFGAGVKYDDLNPNHRLFFQWNLANVADKNFGEGKGPVSQQQKPNGQPSKTPTVKEVVATSPAAKAAAAAALALTRAKSPPDISEFAFSAETDLGQAERIIETGTDEQVIAALKRYPELQAKLEGRT